MLSPNGCLIGVSFFDFGLSAAVRLDLRGVSSRERPSRTGGSTRLGGEYGRYWSDCQNWASAVPTGPTTNRPAALARSAARQMHVACLFRRVAGRSLFDSTTAVSQRLGGPF